MSIRCRGSRCCERLHLHVNMFASFSHCFLLFLCPPAVLISLKACLSVCAVSPALICIYICLIKRINLTFTLFLLISCRPSPVIPSEKKRKWCHVTTTALRGTTGDPGSGGTFVLLASTMGEPIIAVPLLLSMATIARVSFPSQLSPLSCPPQLQLPWQHLAVT